MAGTKGEELQNKGKRAALLGHKMHNGKKGANALVSSLQAPSPPSQQPIINCKMGKGSVACKGRQANVDNLLPGRGTQVGDGARGVGRQKGGVGGAGKAHKEVGHTTILPLPAQNGIKGVPSVAGKGKGAQRKGQGRGRR